MAEEARSFLATIEPVANTRYADRCFRSEVIAECSDDAVEFFRIWLSDKGIVVDDGEFSLSVSCIGRDYFKSDVGIVQGVHVRFPDGRNERLAR